MKKLLEVFLIVRMILTVLNKQKITFNKVGEQAIIDYLWITKMYIAFEIIELKRILIIILDNSF